jgi:hypothetical protein
VLLSDHVVLGQTAVQTLVELMANSAGMLGHTETQVRVLKSAMRRGDEGH